MEIKNLKKGDVFCGGYWGESVNANIVIKNTGSHILYHSHKHLEVDHKTTSYDNLDDGNFIYIGRKRSLLEKIKTLDFSLYD